MKKVALSLRGGGLDCLSYLGAIKALKENGIEVSHIIASSAGAVVGSGYACGLDFEQIIQAGETYLFQNFFSFDSIKDTSIASDDWTIGLFESIVGKLDLAETKIPLYIQTTRFKDWKNVVFEKGNIAKIATASMALPIFYSPIEIDGEYYFDGDFSSGFGVDFLKEKTANKILGFVTSSVGQTQVVRSISTLLTNIKKYKDMDDEDIVVVHGLGVGLNPLFDGSRVRETFENGYRVMKRYLSNSIIDI